MLELATKNANDVARQATLFAQPCLSGTAFLRPSRIIAFMRLGLRMSCRKRSSWSSESARKVGAGWLHGHAQSSTPSRDRRSYELTADILSTLAP
jgi:hypothetical protein